MAATQAQELTRLITKTTNYSPTKTINTPQDLDLFIKLNSMTFSATGIKALKDKYKQQNEMDKTRNSSAYRPPKKVAVMTITGQTFDVAVTKDTKVDTLKADFAQKSGQKKEDIFLINNGVELEDGAKTLFDYCVQEEDLIFQVLCLGSSTQAVQFSLSPDLLDPGFNYSFKGIDDGDKMIRRGGLRYFRPCGCMRYALKVSGKYDGGNDLWLGSSNVDGEWAVAYHTTQRLNLDTVIDQVSAGKLDKAAGVYCTQSVKVAIKYANSFTDGGRTKFLLFQTRVNPKKIVPCKTKDGDELWLITDPDAVRSYSICVYEK